MIFEEKGSLAVVDILFNQVKFKDSKVLIYLSTSYLLSSLIYNIIELCANLNDFASHVTDLVIVNNLSISSFIIFSSSNVFRFHLFNMFRKVFIQLER